MTILLAAVPAAGAGAAAAGGAAGGGMASAPGGEVLGFAPPPFTELLSGDIALKSPLLDQLWHCWTYSRVR